MAMTKKTNFADMVNHLLHREKSNDKKKSNDKNVLVRIGSEWVICSAK